MRGARLVVAGVAVLALAGCTGEKTVSASSLVGGTMADAYRTMEYNPQLGQMPPEGVGVVTYNLTPRVSTTPGGGGPPGDDWVVVAACFKDEQLPGSDQRFARVAVGAIPANLATEAVKAEARAGRFNAALTECPGTSDTFEVPTP